MHTTSLTATASTCGYTHSFTKEQSQPCPVPTSGTGLPRPSGPSEAKRSGQQIKPAPPSPSRPLSRLRTMLIPILLLRGPHERANVHGVAPCWWAHTPVRVSATEGVCGDTALMKSIFGQVVFVLGDGLRHLLGHDDILGAAGGLGAGLISSVHHRSSTIPSAGRSATGMIERGEHVAHAETGVLEVEL